MEEKKQAPVVEHLIQGETVYHGTSWSCDDNFIKPFKHLEAGAHNDLNVAWVTDKIEIAEGFAKEAKFQARESKTAKKVILKGTIQRNLNLLDLNEEKVCINIDKLPQTEDELEEFGVAVDKNGDVCLSIDDFAEKEIFENINEIYSFIDDKKFDGAFKSDADYDGRPYRDLALFRPESDVVFDMAIIGEKEIPIDAAIAKFNENCKKKK